MTATVKTTLVDRIKQFRPCRDAVEWLRGYSSPQKAWDACERGDWMLWLIGKQVTSPPWSDDRKPLLACCFDIAETVKHLWPKAEAKKIGAAIAELRAWIVGEADAERAKRARQDLYAAYAAAAAAAAAAADAAYAAADAAAAYAAYATAATATATAATATAAAAATAAADAAYAADAAAAYAAATAAAYAAAVAAVVAAARKESLKRSANIVREHFRKPPKIKAVP